MVGVVADDITGANDIGLNFAKHGYRAEVYSDYQNLDLNAIRADVVILDTNSRCDRPEEAYTKVAAATRMLLPLNCRLLVKKTCSVFRGNVGVEFDAMLDAAGADFAVVVAAFPKNGRITRHGIHYVHGRLLAESEFAHDPVHPMDVSDLRTIVARQARRPVDLLDYTVICQGVAAVRAKVNEARRRGGYLIADATSQEDLRLLAKALAEERMIFGSSALAEELPAFWDPPKVGLMLDDLPRSQAGTLIIAGSVTPQTRGQVARAKEAGIAAFELDPRKIFDAVARQHELDRLVDQAFPLLASGRTALVYGSHQPEQIAATYCAAEQTGLQPLAASRALSATLGEVGRRIVELAGVKRLIVAGGETSNDVCRALGITGNLILREIQPGLPSSLSLGERRMLLVLKSGSFGTPDFLLTALEHLSSL